MVIQLSEKATTLLHGVVEMYVQIIIYKMYGWTYKQDNFCTLVDMGSELGYIYSCPTVYVHSFNSVHNMLGIFILAHCVCTLI